MLHRRQIFLKCLLRRTPSKRPHGKAVIVSAVINLKLLRKVRKRIKGMSGIEAPVILSVAPLHLAVMPWRIRPDQPVTDAVKSQMHLKQGGPVPARGKAVCELRTVVSLDTFNRAWESFHKVLKEHGGGIRTLLLKSLHKAPSGILIDGSILEEMFAGDTAVDKAGGGNSLHIDLEALSGVVHLLIGLWNILRVGRMDGHDALLFEETVKAGDGAGVTALHELGPEDDEPGMRVAPAHVRDELDLFRGMLVRVVVGPAGAVTEGLNGTVKAAFPAVDILPVGLIFDGSVGDTIFIGIIDK